MRSVIEELGDRLVVSFRPRRAWYELTFLSFWLVLWSFGGVMAMRQVSHEGPGGVAFLLFWLSLWAFGECLAAGVLAWHLVGRTILAVGPEGLEVRWTIRRLARAKRWQLEAVQDVASERVPSDEDEKERDDFGLRLSCARETVHVGEGLRENEADELAALVAGRLRPRSWWGDGPAFRRPAPDELPAATTTLSAGSLRKDEPPHARAKAVAAVIAASVVLSGALLAALLHSADEPRQTAPSRAQLDTPPRPEDFVDARVYAAAVTSNSLESWATVVGRIECDYGATFREWSCQARARARSGPFAGRTLVYHCRSLMTGGVLCGPESVDPAAVGSSSTRQSG